MRFWGPFFNKLLLVRRWHGNSGQNDRCYQRDFFHHGYDGYFFGRNTAQSWDIE
jgi:hypothetical protein